MSPTARLDGRIVLVTGAAQGVGAATARALVDAGASVGLIDVAEAPLRELTRQLGDHAYAYAADVTDFDAMTAAVSDLVERVGGIDAVVTNAGIEVLDWAIDMRPEDFRRVVDVNLVGTWTTVRTTLDAVIRRRGYYPRGLVTVSGPNGPMNGAYHAAKAGAVALAQTLRLELRPHGVAVAVAYLTYTDTATGRRAVEDPPNARNPRQRPGRKPSADPRRRGRCPLCPGDRPAREATAVRPAVALGRVHAATRPGDARAPVGAISCGGLAIARE